MKRAYRRRIAWTTALALLAIASAAWAGTTGEDLASQVEIRRTSYGVPHIKAPTLKAVAFGFAYCQAEDHMESIARLYISARGESAKVFGGEGNLRSDLRNRQFRVYERSVETYHRLDADYRSMVEGYAEGLNHYIALHRDELPDWVQPFTPHDVVAHSMRGVARFAFDRGGIVNSFIKRKQNEGKMQVASATGLADPFYPLGPIDPDEAAMGSNMWALGGSRTTSGNAILMGNPHQGWSMVATYYEAHLTVPGKLNFYGTTFIGRCVLTTGFNENLGWTHTVNYPDLEEIYELALDPDDSGRYLFDGGSVPISREEATVEVKRERDGWSKWLWPFRSETRQVRKVFEHTPLGPVIHRDNESIYVLRSAAYNEFRFYQQWLRFAQSENLKQFRAALDILAIPMFNLIYADREGNIFYLWNGTVPDLPHEAHRDEAVRASTSEDIWTRFHSIAELPQVLNPKGGYVQNCNDPPYFTNLNEPLDIESFPEHFPRHRLGLRSQHSLALVHGRTKFSLEDVRDMKFDLGMLLADRVKDDLVALLRERAGDADDKAEIIKAADVIERWNNTVAADTHGSLVFARWWREYAYEGSKLREEAYEIPWSPELPVTTPSGIGEPDRAWEAFVTVAGELTADYGDWDLAWGDVHRIRRGDVDLPASGGEGGLGCFRVIRFKRDPDGKYSVAHGDSAIMAVEFGEHPRAYTVVGYSQSGRPDSPHYNDQTVLYANQKMKRAAFTEDEIEADTMHRYHPGEETLD